MGDRTRHPADLHVADGALSDFTHWLGGIVEPLDNLAADIAELNIATHQYGGAMPAVAEMARQYETARSRLVEFVRIQREAVEMLGIAAQISERGYEAVDQEQLDRLRQITSTWNERYPRPPRIPEEASGGGGGGRDMAL
ncbi:hypothetical protein [Streptomyces hoynatensis]|uniref:PE domain-containing protein n=1 Tax=Streptomyces hoynatensis TaxID=1141874 RepID=A0A3A9YT92_9ACTN|nr:hypothetical protein [Streptomyces hoynatensis]RKN38724.1 hypothetical protein D7294_23100 [Streptomyces hoynatensis]